MGVEADQTERPDSWYPRPWISPNLNHSIYFSVVETEYLMVLTSAAHVPNLACGAFSFFFFFLQ